MHTDQDVLDSLPIQLNLILLKLRTISSDPTEHHALMNAQLSHR